MCVRDNRQARQRVGEAVSRCVWVCVWLFLGESGSERERDNSDRPTLTRLSLSPSLNSTSIYVSHSALPLNQFYLYLSLNLITICYSAAALTRSICHSAPSVTQFYLSPSSISHSLSLRSPTRDICTCVQGRFKDFGLHTAQVDKLLASKVTQVSRTSVCCAEACALIRAWVQERFGELVSAEFRNARKGHAKHTFGESSLPARCQFRVV